jgi:hypothetical protein
VLQCHRRPFISRAKPSGLSGNELLGSALQPAVPAVSEHTSVDLALVRLGDV